MMFFMPTWEEIGSVFLGMFKGIFLNLCMGIFALVGFLFNVLMKITQVDLLNTAGIYQRATMIFTIVTTFYITFEFVKYTVSPDKISDKEKGAIPLFARIIIAILLLAFVPKIFTVAMDLQNRVINTNVIPKVILGTPPTEDNSDIATLGREFSTQLFSVFYRFDRNVCLSADGYNVQKCNDIETKVNEKVFGKMKDRAGIVDILFGGTLFSREVWIGMNVGVEFNPLLGILFGGFMLYVIFMYCKDVALRYVQILFLQIISPLAIISYIAPNKDGMFKKWLKQCTTTYIDIFIRLALLYFMMFVMQAFLTHDLTRDGLNAGLFVKLFILFALLRFVLKAPKMLEELFPKSGSASIGFGFSAKDRKGILGQAWTGGKQVVAKGAGAIAGVARTGKSMKNGTLTSAADMNKNGKISRMRKLATGANAMIRSGAEGFKAGKDGNIGNAIRAGQEKAQAYEGIVARGGTVLGHDFRAGHYQDEQFGLQVKLDLLKQMTDSKSSVNSAIGEIKYRKQMDSVAATLQASGNTAAKVAWDGEIKAFEKLTRNYASGAITENHYKQEVSRMLTEFNNNHGLTGTDQEIKLKTDDLETNKTDIYSAISTRMTTAQDVAKEITKQEIKYTVMTSSGPVEKTLTVSMDNLGYMLDGSGNKIEAKDKNGNPRKDAAGNQIYETFADYIGDFTDAATTAKIYTESSAETKKIQTNAEGKK